MSGLPWVRLDAGIATHDKMLELLDDPSPARYQAGLSYVFSIAWCGQHGTDGLILGAALPFVHGTKTTAALLVKHDLWAADGTGWRVVNYLERQQSMAATTEVKGKLSAASKKGNCIRWHGPKCGCWRGE